MLRPALKSKRRIRLPPGASTPTKLYFHAASHSGTGTFPSGTQSGITPTSSAAASATIKTLTTTKGSSQANNAVNPTAATTSEQTSYHGMWITPALAAATTVGGGNITLLAADSQSHTNTNFCINGLEIYVWRPSTGAKVGTIKAFNSTSLGGQENTVNGTEQTTYITGITSNAVAASVGDVIVCEVWGVFTQADATGRLLRFYYDGTTEYTAENTTTADCASYIEFSETLTF